IVLPKELRRTLRIKEGDELEILPQGENLVLRKYSPFDDMLYASDGVAEMIGEYVGAEVYVIAGDKIISSYGKGKSPRSSKPTESLLKVMSTRSAVVLDAIEIGAIFEGQGVKEGYLIAEPILVNGDLLGTVVVVSKSQPDENKLGYIRFATAILGAVVAQ
ncbi:MAG: AbrB/MazE/SpoVT family DNA-binding domain-containing protein, partial [Clostridia bacterium]|nr:AbrB/MazE/SpoVT family DNA-binding domain-containing protein [Clostridia bacterium]